MEDWATIALVLGSNAIMGAVNWLMMKRQLKHSGDQLEKQLQAQRETDQHNRRWETRSQPLMKLRGELAHMAEKLEFLVDLATQVIEGVDPNIDKRIDELEKAAKNWEAYLNSGEFYQALHMQYDHELKVAAHKISLDYQSAYVGVMAYWRGGKADEKIREARTVMKNNAARIAAVQLKINTLLEEL